MTMNNIQNLKCEKNQLVVKAFIYSSSIMVMATPMLMNVYASGDLFSAAKTAFSSIYNSLLSIVNIVAIVCAVIALLLLIFSKNQRTVESSKEWLKRIVIAWIAINCMGWIVATLTDWVAGGKYNA